MKILAKGKELITNFDSYAAGVGMTVGGKSDAKSFLGAIISIFCLGMSLFLSRVSLSDWFNRTNPKVETVITYDTNSSDFNFNNLFFALSFYDPRNDSVSRLVSSASNNLTSVYYIHPITIQCTSCNSTDNELSLCNSGIFQNKTLRSMTSYKSQGIMSVFQNFSYCLPENFQGTLQDNKNLTASQDSSFQLYIPFSKTSINFGEVKKNDQSSLTSSTNAFVAPPATVTPTPTPTVKPAPTPTPTPTTAPTTCTFLFLFLSQNILFKFI
jgi:hypothetical protein